MRPLRASPVRERWLATAGQMVHLHGPGDRAVAEVAARQHGIVVADQVRMCGLGRRAVANREAKRAWVRLHPGVHLIGTAEPTERARTFAAVAASGTHAVAGAWTALWLNGLTPRLPNPLDIAIVGRANAATPRNARTMRPQHLTWQQVRWRHGVPCTQLAEAIIAVAPTATADELATIVALAARTRLAQPPDIAALLDAHRRPGAPALRKALAEFAPVRSPHEHRLVSLLRRAELPDAQPNAVILGKELDLYWPEAKLGIEVDAFSTHGSPAAFEDDRLVDANLEAAGVRVLRFTARRIREHPEAVVARAAAVLTLRLGGLPPPRRR